jgi:hypothetical protein
MKGIKVIAASEEDWTLILTQPFENQNPKGKEVNAMKKSMSILSNLFLSSTLFWGVATVSAEELVVKKPLDFSGYCHMKFPPMREDTLSWSQPVLDENAGNIIDFYGPCDYDPTGLVERKRQRRNQGVYGDSD